VEPAKDWMSDCLAKRNLLVAEICGVLGSLHSMEGLAHSNNNAKLNSSATHDQTLLATCEIEKTEARNVAKVKRAQQITAFFDSACRREHREKR
jgi:hypothetical protein